MARVSAIIPVYNSEAAVAATIDSALNQTFEDREVVVVNDGSTDSTATILRAYGSRIKLINRSSRAGMVAARNTGVDA